MKRRLVVGIPKSQELGSTQKQKVLSNWGGVKKHWAKTYNLELYKTWSIGFYVKVEVTVSIQEMTFFFFFWVE